MFLVDAVVLAQEEGFTQQPGPLWVLGQVGVVGAISTIFAMLHRSAVNAYREVAQSYQRIAEIERKRADTSNEQLLQLLDPIRKVGDSL